MTEYQIMDVDGIWHTCQCVRLVIDGGALLGYIQAGEIAFVFAEGKWVSCKIVSKAVEPSTEQLAL
jgi:hypothetical protein